MCNVILGNNGKVFRVKPGSLGKSTPGTGCAIIDDDPLLRRARGLGLSRLSYWLFALCAAVELYPEAAAAVSIVAEDARIQLVTPTVFGRLMVAVGQASFAEALAAGLEGAPLRRAGLIEAVEVMQGLPANCST